MQEPKPTFNKKCSSSISHINTADGSTHILARVGHGHICDKQTTVVAIKLGHQTSINAEIVGDKPLIIPPPVELH